jgi:hypothetical protein
MKTFIKPIDEVDEITTIDLNLDRLFVMDASSLNKLKKSSPSNFASQLQFSAEQITSGILPNGRFPLVLPAVSGANLTNLNASNLVSGTIPDGRFPLTLPALNGANLSALNASALAVGTIPDARFPATLPAVSGAQLTNLNANSLAAGTIPDARFPSILPALNGSNLTTLNGSQITTGTVAEARISSDISRKNKTTFSIGTGTYGLLAADSDKVILAAGGGAITVEVSANVVAGSQFTIVNFGSTLSISASGGFTGYYTDTNGAPQIINPGTSLNNGNMNAIGFVARIYVIAAGIFILDARNL